jgi:hypothetical protein
MDLVQKEYLVTDSDSAGSMLAAILVNISTIQILPALDEPLSSLSPDPSCDGPGAASSGDLRWVGSDFFMSEVI